MVLEDDKTPAAGAESQPSEGSPPEKGDGKGSASNGSRSRSKSVSEPKLESVKEGIEDNTGEDLKGSSTVSAARRDSSCPRFFGVRSYLHNFYDSVKLKEAHKYQDYEEYRYLIAPKRRHKTLLLWRFLFWLGFSMLVTGVLIMILGYLVPRREVIVTYNQEIGIIDKLAVHFNKTLENFKVIGLGVFCVGGLFLSTALLLPSLVGSRSCYDQDNLDETAPFKVRIGRGGDSDDEDDCDKAAAGVPVSEQVKNVQPQREEEAVITGGTLTKLK